MADFFASILGVFADWANVPHNAAVIAPAMALLLTLTATVFAVYYVIKDTRKRGKFFG